MRWATCPSPLQGDSCRVPNGELNSDWYSSWVSFDAILIEPSKPTLYVLAYLNPVIVALPYVDFIDKKIIGLLLYLWFLTFMVHELVSRALDF